MIASVLLSVAVLVVCTLEVTTGVVGFVAPGVLLGTAVVMPLAAVGTDELSTADPLVGISVDAFAPVVVNCVAPPVKCGPGAKDVKGDRVVEICAAVIVSVVLGSA